MPQKPNRPRNYFGPGNEDIDPNYDPLTELDSAKALLSRLQQEGADTERAVQGGLGGSSKMEQKLKADSSYTKPVKNALDVGALISAFVPNPTSPAAGIYLGARGVEDAAERPSVGSAVMAGLGLIPFMKPLANAAKEFRAGRAIDEVRRTAGAGDMGAAFSREVPYRAPSGTSGEPISKVPGPTRGGHVVGHDLDFNPTPDQFAGGQTPAMAQGPETMLQRARAQVERFLSGAGDAPQGGSTRPTPGRPAPAAGDDIAQMFSTAEANPASMRGLEKAFEIPVEDVMQSPAKQRFGFMRSHDVPPSDTRMDELIKKLGGRGATTEPVATGEYTAMPAKTGGRVGDMHEAQTTGGQFGFDELPEISESELSRLQALFKRLGR
jgi:hypothetical protein